MNTQPTTPLTSIPNLQSGLDLLACLPLANPPEALEGLEQFFDSLVQVPFDTDFYLELLEQSRVPLCFVTEELARRYIGKPLPLGESEAGFFRRVSALWKKVLFAYSRCVRGETARKPEVIHERLALVLHRCIYYAGMLMVEHHRTRHELPPGLWKAVNSYYECAETYAVHLFPVIDSLASQEEGTHCSAAFLSLLLTELASPYSLSTRNQNLVRRWSERWSYLLSLQEIPEESLVPECVIDLRQDAALCTGNESLQRISLRQLDTTQLAQHLEKLNEELRKKTPPAEIGLGEDCSVDQCRRLLAKIINPWLQIRAPRKHRRRSADGIASVCTDFDAVHYLISSGISSVLPVPREDEALQFCREQAKFTINRWNITNQSVNGFRLVRQNPGKPVMHGQLIAIRTHEGEPFLLGSINWLMQENSGRLVVGAEVFAGLPQAIALRPQASVAGGPYRRAFLLPAIPAIGSKESLLLPLGWYRQQRVLEIRSNTRGNPKPIGLGRLLNEGSDFERARFAEANMNE